MFVIKILCLTFQQRNKIIIYEFYVEVGCLLLTSIDTKALRVNKVSKSVETDWPGQRLFLKSPVLTLDV